jgi:hypothetical protein
MKFPFYLFFIFIGNFEAFENGTIWVVALRKTIEGCDRHSNAIK